MRRRRRLTLCIVLDESIAWGLSIAIITMMLVGGIHVHLVEITNKA